MPAASGRMSERIDDAAARLLGFSRSSTTDKGIAKDIRTVLDALTVAQGKAALSYLGAHLHTHPNEGQ